MRTSRQLAISENANSPGPSAIFPAARRVFDRDHGSLKIGESPRKTQSGGKSVGRERDPRFRPEQTRWPLEIVGSITIMILA